MGQDGHRIRRPETRISAILSAIEKRSGRWTTPNQLVILSGEKQGTVNYYLRAMRAMKYLESRGRTCKLRYREVGRQPTTSAILAAAGPANHRNAVAPVLSVDQVVEICWRSWIKKESNSAIGRRVGVTQGTISALLEKKTRQYRDMVHELEKMHARGRLTAAEYHEDTIEYARIQRF